jgi:hypothetical protein
MLHLCEAAEANARLARPNDPGPISKTTVQLEVEGKFSPAGETVSAGEWDGHKTVIVEADSLPTLEQCTSWGYKPHGPLAQSMPTTSPPARPHKKDE